MAHASSKLLLDRIVKHYYDLAMHTNLDQIVRDMLGSRKGDWQALATASDVSYSWLSKFFNGHIPNPGFATLKKLHDELTKQERSPSDAEPTATETVANGA